MMTKDQIRNTPELVDYLLDEAIHPDERTKLRKRLNEVCRMALKALEQEPKTGHWIGEKEVGFREWKDVIVLVNQKGCVTDSCKCSECGEWLTGSDEYECGARYCPNCGAKMESEET